MQRGRRQGRRRLSLQQLDHVRLSEAPAAEAEQLGAEGRQMARDGRCEDERVVTIRSGGSP
jgi:hypothetical protein